MQEPCEHTDVATRVPCPRCAELIMPAARYCRFCGLDLTADDGSTPIGQDSSQLQSQGDNPVETTEVVLFVGHPSLIYSAWQAIPIILSFGLWYLVYLVRKMQTRYTVTSQRVRVERGIFRIQTSMLEVFRIEHFSINQPLGMRLMGFSELVLSTSDREIPEIRLIGIPDVEALAEKLRDRSLEERKRRRVTTFVEA